MAQQTEADSGGRIASIRQAPQPAQETPGTTSPVTPRQVKIAAWICFFAWTFALYDYTLFGNLLPVLAEDFGWSSAMSTGVNTWVTVGTALVAMGIGPIVDRFGRRKGMYIAVIGAAFASLMTALVGPIMGVFAGLGVVLLVLFRSLAGLGFAEQTINAVYLGELMAYSHAEPSKARRRGFIYSLVQSGWPVGSVLAATSISLLLPLGWEWCFVVAAFPAIFMVIAGRYLKETPQFEARRESVELIKAGRRLEAQAVADAAGIDVSDVSTPLAAVFKGESLRSTVVLGGAFFLNWLGTLCFIILGTSLLTATTGKGLTLDNALLILIVSNAGSFAGYLLFGWFGDLVSRKYAIVTGWIISGLAFGGMILVPGGDQNFGLIITLYTVGLIFFLGPYAALLFFSAESFPVHTRATGGAVITAAGQLGAIVGGVLVTAFLAAGHSWNESAFYWGVIPTLASGLLILASRKTDPNRARTD